MCYESVYFASCEEINSYDGAAADVDFRRLVCEGVSFRTGQAACSWNEEALACETSLPWWFLPLVVCSVVACLCGGALWAHFHRDLIEDWLDERAKRLDLRAQERERERRKKLRRQGKL